MTVAGAKEHGGELSCQELVELVTDYLEGALDERTSARVAAHLADCDGCADYVEQMRATVSMLGRVETSSLDEVALAELMAAFRTFHTDQRG